MRLRRAKPRLLFASLAVLLWAATAHASSPDICQADTTCTEHTERAVALAGASDYHGALQAFTAAYATQPEPRLLVNIGRCLFHLKRFNEAIEYYRRFQKAPNFRAESSLNKTCSEFLAEAKSAIATARSQNVGYLVISVGSRGSRVVVDEYEIGPAPLSRTVELKAGRHKVELRGDHPMTSEVTVDAGKETSWSFGAPAEVAIAAPRHDRLPRPRWRIITGAIAIAAGVAMIGIGASALAKNGQCLMPIDDGQCGPVLSGDGTPQSAVYEGLGLGVGMIVPGALLTGAGIGLIAWPGPKRENTPLPAATSGAVFGILF